MKTSPSSLNDWNFPDPEDFQDGLYDSSRPVARKWDWTAVLVAYLLVLLILLSNFLPLLPVHEIAQADPSFASMQIHGAPDLFKV